MVKLTISRAACARIEGRRLVIHNLCEGHDDRLRHQSVRLGESIGANSEARD